MVQAVQFQNPFCSEDRSLLALKKGAIVCDMSSVTPVESKEECYDGLKAKGVGFLDAPVSGGEPGAVNGTLAIMAGGDAEDFEAMQNILISLVHLHF